MRTLAFLSVFALLFTVADAQVQRRPKPVQPVEGPDLVISTPDVKPVSLTKADLRVVINGHLAETTQILTFSNPNDRVLEGELRFPLPVNATVSGYGLDVNGELVDGVPVEKHEARIAFETEMRKGVDPGLMEHVAGNNYRTRIYPIPARGTRTVKVQYICELFATPEGMNYLLPLQWGRSVDKLDLKVEIVRPLGAPVLKGIGDLPVAKADNRVIYQRSYEKIEFKDDLLIAIPGTPRQEVCVERRTGDGAPAFYFLASDLPQIIETRTAIPAAPKHIALFWDTSLSRQGADLAREYALIEAFCKKTPGLHFEVCRFSNVAEPVRAFTIDNGDASALIAYLKAAPLDGATDLAHLRMPEGVDACLLFTDGLANLASPMPAEMPVPIYPISSDSRANHTILSAIAARSGGTYLNLKQLDDAEAVQLIGSQAISLLSVEATEGQVADLSPSHPQPAVGRVVVAGRLLSPAAKLKLNYGRGKNIVASTTMSLSQADAADGTLVSRAWAQRRIGELAVDDQKNHDAMIALGRQFGIVTPNTSLLMLETLEQYLTYKITPPRTRADVYAAYQKRIDDQDQQVAAKKGDKLTRVLAMWNERVAWWDKKYAYAADFRYLAPPATKDGAGRGFVGGRAGAVPAEPRVTDAPRPAATPAPVVVNPSDPQRRFAAESEATIRTPGSPLAVRGTRGEVLNSTAQRNSPEQGNIPYLDIMVYPDNWPDGTNLRSSSNGSGFNASISIKPWNPETPYLIKLRLAKPEDAYAVYLKERQQHASPAFYLDCGNFFIEKGQRDMGVRILTNIAELELDSPALLRVAAYRLAQLGEYELAIDLFEKVVKLRPEEPQSHRDLALALIARGDKVQQAGGSAFAQDYVRAMQLLHHVTMNDWDRFEGIEVIALMEANRLWSRIQKLPMLGELPPNPFDPRLVKLLDCEVRIVLTWDSDLTDMDLWVTEPSGERCMYNHNRTTIGGLISNDFTQGYGPEEYCLRTAMKGKYTIQANFYGSQQQSLSGPTTLQAEVITHFGRPNEKRQSITIRLDKAKDVVDVGTITIE